MTDLTCGFCGTKHTNPADYAKCVAKCAAAKEEEERLNSKKKRELYVKDLAARVDKKEHELNDLYNELEKACPGYRRTMAIQRGAEILIDLFPNARVVW